MLREQRPRELETVLHVGPVHVIVEGQLRQRVRFQLDCVIGETDHVQRVARVLAADQRVERDRHLLGGEEAAAEEHRAAHVDHQHGRSLGHVLSAVDDEVLRRHLHRHLRTLSNDRVEERLLHLEQERVAILVFLQLV